MLLKPTDYTVLDADGNPVITVTLTNFPAILGREIAAKYPMSNMPKLGDYPTSEETMLKLMAYVGIPGEDPENPLMLKTMALINSHIPDGETLMKIEMAMLEKNFRFFQKGRISDFFGEFVQMVVGKIIEMSSPSSEQSSAPVAPPSTNSGQSTT